MTTEEKESEEKDPLFVKKEENDDTEAVKRHSKKYIEEEIEKATPSVTALWLSYLSSIGKVLVTGAGFFSDAYDLYVV